MSRAFVSEDAVSANADALPERPVSAAPNLVTKRGLELIEREVERLEDKRDGSAEDDPALPATARDLRYWRARRASAELAPAVEAAPEEVVFGCVVQVRRRDGTKATYRIVGEDEADPREGLLGYTSPLAQALLGAGVGDEKEVGGGRPAVTVTCITAG